MKKCYLKKRLKMLEELKFDTNLIIYFKILNLSFFLNFLSSQGVKLRPSGRGDSHS